MQAKLATSGLDDMIVRYPPHLAGDSTAIDQRRQRVIRDLESHHLPPIASVTDFNFEWRFLLADNEGFAFKDHDDSQWRSLRLSHDWSKKFPPNQEAGDGATAYLPGGIGWFRKHINRSTALTSISVVG